MYPVPRRTASCLQAAGALSVGAQLPRTRHWLWSTRRRVTHPGGWQAIVMPCRQQGRQRRQPAAARALCRRADGAERLPGQRIDAEGPAPGGCASRDSHIAAVCGVNTSAAPSVVPCCQRSQLTFLVTRSQDLRQHPKQVDYSTIDASLQTLGRRHPLLSKNRQPERMPQQHAAFLAVMSIW